MNYDRSFLPFEIVPISVSKLYVLINSEDSSRIDMFLLDVDSGPSEIWRSYRNSGGGINNIHPSKALFKSDRIYNVLGFDVSTVFFILDASNGNLISTPMKYSVTGNGGDVYSLFEYQNKLY